jgi:ABC-2 type transport system ATP-binding protein
LPSLVTAGIGCDELRLACELRGGRAGSRDDGFVRDRSTEGIGDRAKIRPSSNLECAALSGAPFDVYLGINLIRVDRLTKHFGSTLAVDDLSFTLQPGIVTGFLGPNGSGKSTTMRLMVDLDHPDSGEVRIDEKAYGELRWPLREIGALLEAKSVHPGRTAYNHLLVLAETNGIGRRRIDEVLELVGLTSVATKRAGTFSLGMSQRLGIAAALLGDPAVLLFDEPVNGLDPEGIRWVRLLLRHLASEGRTVFVSSHLMSEMSLTADHVVVIGKGRLIADAPMRDFVSERSSVRVRVSSPRLDELVALVRDRQGVSIETHDGTAEITGVTAPEIGDLAASKGIAVHELTPVTVSLEEAFMDSTEDSAEFRTASAPGAPTNAHDGAAESAVSR